MTGSADETLKALKKSMNNAEVQPELVEEIPDFLPRILVVDDNKAHLLSTSILLKEFDAEVVTAESGEQALKEINSRPNIALVLLDVQMPGMDGFEVAAEVRKDETNLGIPIIFVTGNEESDAIENAYLTGAVDYITKPIVKNVLISKVRVFLDLWLLRSGLQQEVDQRRKAEARIEHLATHDSLTGLLNRRGLQEELEKMVYSYKRQREESAIIYIDLDGFKHINDRFGHEAGDSLLTLMSQNFRDCVRRSDALARIGGDEFIIVVHHIEDSGFLVSLMEKLMHAATAPVEYDGILASISASIGVALYPEHGDTVDSLLRHADQAMYQAKNEGKNTFRFFSEEMDKKAQRLSQVQQNLRKALPQNELSVFYQPIVDVQTGKTVSAEALMRWYSDALGQVFPDEFIPAAEHAGLIPDLGCWILDNAANQVAQWNQMGDFSMRVAVNVSSIQFRNEKLSDTLTQCVNQLGLPRNTLELEITEGLLLDDAPEVTNYLNEIQSLGVNVAIDDFGTGFSALSYLKKYPLNKVKIDRSFVTDLPGDDGDVVLVQAIIGMAHGLGLKVVAEGVETREQWDFLKQVNCDMAQGYYFGRPMTAEDMQKRLQDEHGD